MSPRKRKTWIIYPEYFDKELTRSEGRRVPVSLAIKSPTVDDINRTLSYYNIPNRVETHKHYPSTWYERRGRVLLTKQNITKQSFLKKLSEKMKERRSS